MSPDPTSPAATTGPLQLADAPRVEVYELTRDDGTIVEVKHNTDEGSFSYRDTGRRVPVTWVSTPERGQV